MKKKKKIVKKKKKEKLRVLRVTIKVHNELVKARKRHRTRAINLMLGKGRDGVIRGTISVGSNYGCDQMRASSGPEMAKGMVTLINMGLRPCGWARVGTHYNDRVLEEMRVYMVDRKAKDGNMILMSAYTDNNSIDIMNTKTKKYYEYCVVDNKEVTK